MPSTVRGFSVTIVVPDGQVDGLRTIEKSNWDGAGIISPRSLWKDSRNRPEFGSPGVYILIGPIEGNELAQKIYIGEGDPIVDRLKDHDLKKDFWERLVAFTSSRSGGLNKAHIQHLEARMIQLAKEARRCTVVNEKNMEQPTLSERDRIQADGFLEEILLCLPVLGVHIFEKAPQPPLSKLLFKIRSKGLEATGFESPQGFVVLNGSQVGASEAPSIHEYLKSLRASLTEKGVLSTQESGWHFTMDYQFDSPSTAAGVVLGRSANGRTEWKNATGKTLKENQGS
jgi:hypothetical protein